MLRLLLLFALIIASSANADCIEFKDTNICTKGEIHAEKDGANTTYVFKPTFFQELFDSNNEDMARGIIRIMKFQSVEELKEEFNQLSKLGTEKSIDGIRYVKGTIYSNNHLFFIEYPGELTLLYVTSREPKFVNQTIVTVMGNERSQSILKSTNQKAQP